MTAKVFPGKIKNCTHCGSPLHRIHRNAFDKLINYLIAINRYSCSNHECGFNGLKISKKPKKRRVSNTSVKKNLTIALLIISMLIGWYFLINIFIDRSATAEQNTNAAN